MDTAKKHDGGIPEVVAAEKRMRLLITNAGFENDVLHAGLTHHFDGGFHEDAADALTATPGVHNNVFDDAVTMMTLVKQHRDAEQTTTLGGDEHAAFSSLMPPDRTLEIVGEKGAPGSVPSVAYGRRDAR
jgi:hypothetical protein